jgi:AcrR family transcriptional regulator
MDSSVSRGDEVESLPQSRGALPDTEQSNPLGGERLDLVSEQILDAALDQFQLVGIRRASVEDVARRAGVSRITVYRRFPRKEVLIEAVAMREARRLVAAVDAATSAISGFADQIVESFVVMLRLIREHPLVRQLLAVEPDEMLRTLTVRGGPVIAIGTTYVADQIRLAQQAGEASPYDPEPAAEILARLAQSLLLTPDGVIPVDDESAERDFARAHLAPLIVRAHAG